MKSFSELLKDEIELTFFVSMLIGHGGNSGGQTVSAVIRALGSGQVTPRDAGRTVAKETAAGFCQSVALAAVVVPALLAMGITRRVTAVVALALPALGVLANGLGSLSALRGAAARPRPRRRRLAADDDAHRHARHAHIPGRSPP